MSKSKAIFRLNMVLAIQLAGVLSACAQTSETFDGPLPSWNLYTKDIDCRIEDGTWQQHRSNSNQAANEGYETIEFSCTSGSRIIVHHNVTPSFVIPELTPSIRLKSAREGVAIAARIVLPHSLLPDGTPITVDLDGPVLRRRSSWQTLEFADQYSLSRLLDAELSFLRSKHQREISVRDAYLDQLLINVYTGPGKSRIAIDRFDVQGVVEAKRFANRSKDDSNTKLIDNEVASRPKIQTVNAASAESLVKRDGSVLLVEKKPFFPRIIEHNGESFEFLKAIGFNTIELKSNATIDQLREARKAGVWLIAPPPASVGVEPIGFEYDSVLAWSVGRMLTGRNEAQIRQLIHEIRETDQRSGRPVFGHSVSHWSRIAQQVDIHSIGLQPVGTSYLLSQYSDWLEQRKKSVGSNQPLCADIQTEMNPAVVDQTSAIFGSSPPTPLEFQQVKCIATEAIAAGCRCLRFRSANRLDGNDPESRLRSLTLQYVNRWLAQIEHWVSGGAVLGTWQDNRNGVDLQITALATNRARLLLVQRPTHHEQYWAGDSPVRSITVFDADTIHTSRVYELNDFELTPLSTQRTPEGTAVTIDQAPFMVTLVMTQDAALLNELTRKTTDKEQQSMFDMHVSMTQQWLAIEQLLSEQLTQLSRSSVEGNSALNEAVTLLQNVRQLSQRKSYSQAKPFLDRADERLAFFRRDVQAKALGTFQSKTSSALTMHSSLIPLHWVLANQLPKIDQAINHLAAGDFEDLDLVSRSGWSNDRIEDHRLRTLVELSSEAARDGETGLMMTVNGSMALVESVPLWVSSPSIRIKPRQLVRIHGWVNISKAISGSEAGLRIVDSIGGPSLAEHVIKTNGWEQFTLYRTAAEDTNLQMKFELTGIGQAMIDEVTVQIIDLPSPTRSARK